VSTKLKTIDSISLQSDRMPTRAGHAKIRAFAFARHKPVPLPVGRVQPTSKKTIVIVWGRDIYNVWAGRTELLSDP